MKKFVIVLLVLSLLCLNSCGLFNKEDDQPSAVEIICETANSSTPTKITTEVNYVTNSGDPLKGYYVTTTDGTNAIFEYYYERLATPAESIASGNSDRIISFEGIINFKDGTYFGDEEEWKPGSGTAFDLKFNMDAEILSDAVVNEDGNILDATVSAEELVSLIGTDLNAIGDATISLTTNGVNLTAVTVSCATANGTITIRTSYTYNQQELFPEPEEDVEDTEGEEGTEETENTQTAE